MDPRYEDLWAKKVKNPPWSPGEGGAYGRNERVLDAMKNGELRTGGSYLDLGAGRGDLAAEVRRRRHYEEVVLVDGSEEARDYAQNYHEFPFRQVYGIELTRLWPWTASVFGAITCLDVIEHIYPFDIMLREAFRCLKPGGQLWLSTPNLLYEGWLMTLLRGDLPRTSADGDEPLPHGGHVTPGFTYYYLDWWLQKIGFTTERFGMPSQVAGYADPFLRQRWLEGRGGTFRPAWEAWDAGTCDLIIRGTKP